MNPRLWKTESYGLGWRQIWSEYLVQKMFRLTVTNFDRLKDMTEEMDRSESDIIQEAVKKMLDE